MAVPEAETSTNEPNGPETSSGLESIGLASRCGVEEMALFVHASEPVLRALLTNPHFGEREALLLLNRRDLPPSIIQELPGLRTIFGSYAVKRALTTHPGTPLRIALAQLKFLYLFDLVSVCVQSGVRPELKRASEELILAQAPKLAAGQRITLAKRGSARLAVSLLQGENIQIIQAVLDNPYLTEAVLLPVLNRSDCTMVEAIASHPRWGLRYDIRLALLRKSILPLTGFGDIARAQTSGCLRNVSRASSRPASNKVSFKTPEPL